MNITEAIALLLACEAPHGGCDCAHRISIQAPVTPTGRDVAIAIGMLARSIETDWTEAMSLNGAFDAGARGWMKRAITEPAPSEKELG